MQQNNEAIFFSSLSAFPNSLLELMDINLVPLPMHFPHSFSQCTSPLPKNKKKKEKENGMPGHICSSGVIALERMMKSMSQVATCFSLKEKG
jgi:hypothetical protein